MPKSEFKSIEYGDDGSACLFYGWEVLACESDDDETDTHADKLTWNHTDGDIYKVHVDFEGSCLMDTSYIFGVALTKPVNVHYSGSTHGRTPTDEDRQVLNKFYQMNKDYLDSPIPTFIVYASTGR